MPVVEIDVEKDATDRGDEAARFQFWIRVVLFLSVISIIYSLLEGVFSLFFGVSGESVSLGGFGTDSLVEVVASVFVLWRFSTSFRQVIWKDSAMYTPHAKTFPIIDLRSLLQLEEAGRDVTGRSVSTPEVTRREKVATLSIGILLGLLGVGAFVSASIKLLTRTPPSKDSLPGLIISMSALVFMSALWYFKMRAAVALNSSAMEKDASCSLGCMKLSAVLFFGSLLYKLEPRIWWADSISAMAISLLIFVEAVHTIKSATSASFSGCAGCCGGSENSLLIRYLRKELFPDAPTSTASNHDADHHCCLTVPCHDEHVEELESGQARDGHHGHTHVPSAANTCCNGGTRDHKPKHPHLHVQKQSPKPIKPSTTGPPKPGGCVLVPAGAPAGCADRTNGCCGKADQSGRPEVCDDWSWGDGEPSPCHRQGEGDLGGSEDGHSHASHGSDEDACHAR